MTTHSHKKSESAPWDKESPKAHGHSQHLTPAQKASAKRHAKAAGRPYPNLVDNMHAAAAGHAGKGKSTSKSKSTSKTKKS